MRTIGELIRDIRIDKGMSQEETAADILSRSHLSELEHNNYYPSYDKMMKLIYRLGLSLEEFEVELHQIGYFFEDSYCEQANTLSTESKVDELATFLETEFTEDIAKRSIRLTHKRLNMLGLVDFAQHNGVINYERYKPLFTYLLACQNWHSYELSLLSNCIFLAPYATAKVLATQFANKYKHGNFYEKERKIPVLFNNLAEMTLINNEPQMALVYCNTSQNYTVKNHDLYNQLISETLAAIANYRLEKASAAEIENYLSLFERFHYPETSQYYLNLCKNLTIKLKK